MIDTGVLLQAQRRCPDGYARLVAFVRARSANTWDVLRAMHWHDRDAERGTAWPRK